MIECRSNPYHRKCKSNSFDWNRREEFMENNPVSIFVLEPRHIDCLLDDRMSIWLMGHPAEIEFLYAKVTQSRCTVNVMGLTP